MAVKLKPLSSFEVLCPDEPIDYQEQHSPTVIDEIKIKLKDASRVTRERIRRRRTDAQLWGSFSELETQAAERIAWGFNIITEGVGYKGQSFERKYGSGDPLKAVSASQDYTQWVLRCQSAGVNIDWVLKVLVEGASPRAIDRQNRRQSGACRENLLAGLGVYIRLKRWHLKLKSLK
jgi:hypothetical protein